MDTDDLEPRQKKPAKPRDLTGYSVDELNEYIALLNAEADRARLMIASKTAHRDAAAKFFKS